MNNIAAVNTYLCIYVSLFILERHIKSQGQTLNMVGIYFPKPAFSQAVLCATSREGMKVLAPDQSGEPTPQIRNIAYREVLGHL
jgi:hypothetical protein